MAQQSGAGIDIKNKKLESISAPTPQNTPSNPTLPTTSTFKPQIAPIAEQKSDDNNLLAGAFTGNPMLISMLQGKLGQLVGQSSGYIESLPTPVKRRLDALKHFQSEHDTLKNKFQDEVYALERKYHELYGPLYEKREQVINGKYTPTEEEVALGAKIDVDEEDEEDSQDAPATGDASNVDDEDIKGIPEFWLTAMKNHPQIGETITKEDEPALSHLVDVRLSYMDKPGFKLDFYFDKNDYFENDVLSKTYYYQESKKDQPLGDLMYDHAEGCDINWKEGKNLTVTVESKKQRHKGTNKTRVVKRTVPAQTFFAFFSPPTAPSDDEEEVLEEEDAERLNVRFQADYEAGEEFKESIIPRAVDFFTGKALEDYEDFDEEEFEEDFYDEEDDEEEDEDDEDEEDDDDDDAKPQKGESAPECKQS